MWYPEDIHAYSSGLHRSPVEYDMCVYAIEEFMSTPYATITPYITTTPGVTITPYSTTTPFATTTPGSTTTPFVTTTPIVTTTPFVTTTPIVTTTPFVTTTPYITTTPIVTTTPFATTTPISTTMPTPTVNISRDINSVDTNGYICQAIQALTQNHSTSAMNYTNLAINIQSSAGNGVGVAMLQAANLYIQAILNPLLNNFGIPDQNLTSAAIYYLVGTILCLLFLNNPVDLQGSTHPNIQSALKALNSNPPNLSQASNSLQAAITANAAIPSRVQILKQILGVVQNYNLPSLKNLPLTPLQMSLTDFPMFIFNADGYPMQYSSVNNYSSWWNSINIAHRDRHSKWVNQPWGNQGGTNQQQTNDNPDNLPDPIQQYLVARTVLNAAMNDMTNYLNTKTDYQPLIANIQKIQNNMNTI